MTSRDGLIAVAVFVAALVLYARTVAPGLLLGDSAELQVQAYVVGHTHPTGYPVYVLAVRAFTSLATGDLAARVNLFSAVCASGALAALYLVGRLLGGWRVAALVGPAALAVVPLFWMHAAIAELYAPAALLLVVVVLLLVLGRERRDARWLAAAATLGGLSLGVHPTVALAAPAALVYVAALDVQGKWRASIIGALAGALLALGAFFVVDSVNAPASYFNTVVAPSFSAWGLTAQDMDQPWERLAFSLEARQFQHVMVVDPLNSLRDNGPAYFGKLQAMWPSVALVLAGLGTLGLLIRQTREGVLVGLAWLIQFAFVLNYGVFDIQVFYIPGYTLIALAISYGLATLLDGVARAISRDSADPGRQRVAGAAGLIVLAFVLWPAVAVVRTAWTTSQPPGLARLGFGDYPYPVRTPDAPLTQARALVDGLEDDAIVFTTWDTLYADIFAAHVLEGRSGIAFHETLPQDGLTGLADSTLAYIETVWQARPVYFTERPGPDILLRYRLEQVDGLYKIVAKRTP